MRNAKWFKEVATVDELRTAFKKLVFKYHPDVTKRDTTKEMQEINAEYELLFKTLPKTATNKRTTSPEELNDGFREILVKIANLPDLDIEICGTWIWVSGQTMPVKNELKEAGFKWAAKKKMWYWRNDDNAAKHNRKNIPMDEIRMAYGSEKVESTKTKKLQTA